MITRNIYKYIIIFEPIAIILSDPPAKRAPLFAEAA